MEKQAEEKRHARRRGFLRKVRWTFYGLFIALLIFVVVCLAWGIGANLRWRYTDLDLPVDRPEKLEEVDALQLRDCRLALEKLQSELRENVDRALDGASSRSELLRRWNEWNKGWRVSFERIGFSCRLGEMRYDRHPALGVLAGIYRLLDGQQKALDRMVRSFLLENARQLQELHSLLEQARTQESFSADSLP
jgi:hypothetical protein